MGALIHTSGTKKLAAHYNDEFDTFIEFYRQANIIGHFNRSGTDWNVWDNVIQQIKHSDTTDPSGDFPDHTDRNDGLCLLPAEKKSHKNLITRWRIYLKKVLPTNVHNHLIDAIYNVLLDNSYDYIVFDAVEDVTYAIDATDKVDPDGSKFKLIVLKTIELPVDPGYGPNAVRDHRPV
jgi:hypothetical protein